MADGSGDDAPASKKRKRSRTGCLNCRRRRKLCDERKPACVRCERMGERCAWPAAFSFRESGWQGKLESATPATDSKEAPPPGSKDAPPPGSKDAPPPGSKDAPPPGSTEAPPPGQLSPTATEPSVMNGGHAEDGLAFATPQATVSAPLNPSVSSSSEHAVSAPSAAPSLAMSGQMSALMQSPLESPDAFVGYYPNAEYRHLHATLYDAMVDTARESADVTRSATPDRDKPTADTLELEPIPQKSDPIRPNVEDSLPDGITFARERELWASYIAEIAPWLDMFDNENHFRLCIPMLARSSAALRLSVLALSSRQLERLDPTRPYTESLALYHEAIHLVTQELRFMQTPLIASCVLLCVLEMMSSSPRDWARHLEGCASLIKAAGIDGSVGGMEQAIFWCFARMDMWGSFLTDTSLRIPTSLWFFPVEPIPATLDRLRLHSSAFDQYANLAVFLCASTLNVLSRESMANDEPYNQQWRAMFDLLEAWYDERPSEMLPVLYSVDSKTSGSFPVVLFTNASAISGNQLYHAAALLMLQAKPADVKHRSHKSLFWHARHIIGISASNPNHGARVNSPQPIWIAGRMLSHPDEHRTVLRLLDDIEKETGFATAWRAEDLKNHWGEV